MNVPDSPLQALPTTESSCDVLVIGAGIVGVAIALRLQQDGRDVLLIDRECVAAGIVMTIEDTWGGDFVTAAIAHLAQSTPEEFLLSTTDFNSYGTRDIATGAPKRVNGVMNAAATPGIGCIPIREALGRPVATFP